MKIKFLSFVITFLIAGSVFSQSNLNNYKYVIVPSKFDFLKEKDQYQLNALAKFLFNKYGFETLIEGESYPDDLARNRCLGLRSNVTKGSGMFKTKLTIALKNCDDQSVFVSKIGESREKEYGRAYTLALRSAFESVKELNHTYKPSEDNVVVSTTTEVEATSKVTMEIEALKNEIQNLKAEKETALINQSEEQGIVQNGRLEEGSNTSIETELKEVVSRVLYAQEIENGFQLVDSTPKVVYSVKQTGLDNVFLVEGKNAVLYKKENTWILEYYSGNTLKRQQLNIKF